MDNRDFWPYIRVAKLPEFDPLFISSSPPSRPPSFFSWLFTHFRSVYRYCYAHLHDLILSSLFGYLTLNERLYVATHENDLYKARQLLAHGASPSYIPVDYKSVFAHIIKNNREIKNLYTETSLFASILASDSMLYMAVSNNNFNLVKELVKYHDYGQFGHHTEVISLCLAVKRCYFNIVKYLIDSGHINPNDRVQIGCKHCKTQSDETHRYQFPLYHACRENHMRLVKYLVEVKECDINQLTTTYETSLHGAILGAIENRFDSSFNNHQRYVIVKYLLARSECNPDLGLNPLCVSLAHDHIYDYTSLLLQRDCNVNRLGWNRYETSSTNPNHQTNNHLPYSLDHPLNICLRLLCPSNENTTVADHSRHRQHALELIDRNAYIYTMYEFGSSYPFLLAVQTGDKEIVDAMLTRAGPYLQLNVIEPLIYACTKSFYKIVHSLVAFGFNPNTVMHNRDRSNLTNRKMSTLSQLSSIKETPDPILATLNDTNPSNFLQYLDRYCVIPSEPNIPIQSSASPVESNRSCPYINSEQQMTALLAVSRLSGWIFHPDTYQATVKTIEYLFSGISVDFSVRPNRLAFFYALLNEHVPIIYYCLAHFCPVNLLSSTIEFRSASSRNHFSWTLFDVISVCCRLTDNHRVKRTLLDSYAKTILRIQTYDRSSSMANVAAYMQPWLKDEDLVYDQALFEHLLSLPYLSDIIESYDPNKLRSLFGIHYERIVERRLRPRSLLSLKQICRSNIRTYAQLHCDRRQVNLLKIMPQLDCLPKTLQAYLFYTRIKSKALINLLLNREQWNTIQWM